MVDVKDKIPRGIWKILAEEPVDRTEKDVQEEIASDRSLDLSA
jgi:hypothetical protein